MEGMDGATEVTLNDGNVMPRIGLGVFKVSPDEIESVVVDALEVGYRAIDTAAAYGNEEGVGRAIGRSDLPREELFVTTKLWPSDQGYDATLRAFEQSMSRIGLDRLDLYLIHWPAPERGLFVESWRAMERLKHEGRVASIGVSNFRIVDLERLMAECETVPAVNQIELHPYLPQAELREFHAAHGIATEAWSPLAKSAVLPDETLADISAETGRTPSQIVLRWHLQLGNIVIPKTVKRARMVENLGIFDFELSAEQMAEIARLANGTRTGPDPAHFGN